MPVTTARQPSSVSPLVILIRCCAVVVSTESMPVRSRMAKAACRSTTAASSDSITIAARSASTAPIKGTMSTSCQTSMIGLDSRAIDSC